MTTATTAAVSQDCEAILAAHDMYAIRPPLEAPGVAAIYDCDGAYVATVSANIDRVSLLGMLSHGQAERRLGARLGREEARAEIRKALGIKDPA